MCKKCSVMEELVKNDSINIKLIEEQVNNKVIELFAGNCTISEISYHMDKGNHYTIHTIYKCNYCNAYYHIGFCLYGRPIIKLIDREDALERISRFEWGYVGTYFKSK